MRSTMPPCEKCNGLGAYGSILAETMKAQIEAADDLADVHDEIKRVSAQLYRDGHYRQAALDAYIRVIDEVKLISKLPLDGEPLMNRAFGCTRQTPVIQFNPLSNQGEVDEQNGIMNLFKGIVGLRNRKAHTLTPLDDPERAHGYLSLASLLIRLLEVVVVNQTPAANTATQP